MNTIYNGGLEALKSVSQATFTFNIFSCFKRVLNKGDKNWDASGQEICTTQDLDQNCLIMFSSGTTGPPKAIPYTHKMLWNLCGSLKSMARYCSYVKLHLILHAISKRLIVHFGNTKSIFLMAFFPV